MTKEVIVKFYNNFILNKISKENGYKRVILDDHGSIVIGSKAIRFLSKENNSKGSYILFFGNEAYFWSDFSKKDEHSVLKANVSIGTNKIGKAAEEKSGSFVGVTQFMSDMSVHMPHHFEWCLWNLL